MVVIDEKLSKTLLNQNDVTQAVADAFVALYAGEAEIFPVAHGHGQHQSSSFSMKSGYIAPLRTIGLKVGSYWPTNELKGLANHSSAVLLLDPETGHVQALVSTSHLNGMRTAAADALAVRMLAQPGAETLGIVGAGHQAFFEALAVCGERNIKRIRIWSRDEGRANNLSRQLINELGVAAYSAPIEEVCGSDIVVTVTPSNMPLLQWDWVKPGCHISAMGADQSGKQELARPYPQQVRLFADFPEQSARVGEFQGIGWELVPLGAVLAGSLPGRQSESEITVFDSSGLAVQDLAVAAEVVRRHKAATTVQAMT